MGNGRLQRNPVPTPQQPPPQSDASAWKDSDNHIREFIDGMPGILDQIQKLI